MDLNKFTQKSLQAVQDCQKLAYQYGNQKIGQEHLLLSLLTQEESLLTDFWRRWILIMKDLRYRRRSLLRSL